MSNTAGLTPEEFKKLVIDVAVKISPTIVKNSLNSDDASSNIALNSYHIADAVNSILKDPSGHGL
tara:strand:+ start:494 stop:688 length:195 start_codon:yes stop_codon:yes gene_type:complete